LKSSDDKATLVSARCKVLKYQTNVYIHKLCQALHSLISVISSLGIPKFVQQKHDRRRPPLASVLKFCPVFVRWKGRGQ